jgi:hypothetical protein
MWIYACRMWDIDSTVRFVKRLRNVVDVSRGKTTGAHGDEIGVCCCTFGLWVGGQAAPRLRPRELLKVHVH